MSQLLDFFGALYGATDTPVRVTLGDAVQETRDADLLVANEGDVYAEALLPDGTAPFMWAISEDSDPDGWRECQIPVTAALYNPVTRTTLLFWAFDISVPKAWLEPFAEAFGVGLDEPFPTPGCGDWTLAACDPDAFTTFDDFERAYGDPEASDGEVYAEVSDALADAGEAALDADLNGNLNDDEPLPDDLLAQADDESPPWDEPEPDYGRYGDAVIKAPYDEGDPQLQREIVVTVGANSKSTHWKPTTMPLGGMIAMLAQHKVGPKDGLSWVLGDMVGGMRNIKAVKSLTAVGLDIDTGMSSEAIDAELKKLGCLAIRYSTHSHMRGTIEVPKDTIARWVEKTRGGIADLTDDETIQDFLREAKHYDEAIARTARFIDFEHTEKGIVAKIAHDPMPKNRVVLPLAKPFVIADEGQSQKDAEQKWRKIPAALARLLGDIPLDKTGSDPNRLFYLPRHAKGAPFEVALFGGPCLDWTTLELDDPFEVLSGELNTGRSKSTTEEGRSLGRWFKKCGHGFQIADLLRDHCADKVRSDNNAKMEIECPFDEHHSNAGDPEDRACLVVNAGEGAGEFFTVSCRHESCQDRTMLDMVGKMVADGWFDGEELESEHYNALAPEDAPDAEAAVKIAKQDDARKVVEQQAEEGVLNEDSDEEDVRAAIKAVLDADLGKIKEERELTKLRKMVGSSAAVWKQVVGAVRNPRPVKGEDGKKPKVRRDDAGRVIFPYQGEIDFHDAAGHCMETLIQASKKEPKFASLEDKPVMMSQTKTGRICFTELTNRRLWAELNSRITFCRIVDEGDGPRTSVPKEVADQIYETAYEHLPPAPEIIYTPMFNASGKLICEPGWYQDDEILMPNLEFDVPEVPAEPTAEDVEAAVELLLNDLLPDFPFLDMRLDGTKSRAPSQANALAMILTPFMRRMIDGCTPVFFISKPQPGTGGTLLGRIPMILFDGEESPSMIYTENPDEMAKGLLAGALAARSHMFFDDVKAFNNREILRATTSNQIGGRVLGATKTAEVANRFNWVATGNNPFITSEMERRICWVRLNAEMPDIQKRVFRHPDFNVWLKVNRAQIITAILTLIQHWIVNTGCAPFTERKQASFEDWAAKVGGVLQAAGIEGFLDNRREAEMDLDDAALIQFIRHWWKKWGQEMVAPNDIFQEADNIASDLIDGNVDDRRTRTKFIKIITTNEGRVFELDDKNVSIQRTVDRDKAPAFRLGVIEK